MQVYRKNIKNIQRIEYGIYQFLDHFLGRKRVYKILGKRRNDFYKHLEKTLEKSGDGKAIEIERRTDITLNEFRKEYLKKGIPVIMEGAAKDWDCVNKWSLDYFKELHGTDKVDVDSENSRRVSGVTTLTDIIDNIKSGGKKYYRFYPLLRRHPEHINDFDTKWLRERKNKNSIYEEFTVAIGGKGTNSNLHNENRGNLFVQVFGEKKWILYPPYYSSIMDPHPIKNAYRGATIKKGESMFDPFNPNYDTPFSIFKYIDHYETTLKPGDVLWVPTFYWHTVINPSDSIGVGYRWLNFFVPFKTAPLYMFLDYFVTKPFIWRQIKGLDRVVDLKKGNKGY